MENVVPLQALGRLRSRIANGQAQAIREAAGITRLEAARAAQINPETLRLWELGKAMPRGGGPADRYAVVLDRMAAHPQHWAAAS